MVGAGAGARAGGRGGGTVNAMGAWVKVPLPNVRHHNRLVGNVEWSVRMNGARGADGAELTAATADKVVVAKTGGFHISRPDVIVVRKYLENRYGMERLKWKAEQREGERLEERCKRSSSTSRTLGGRGQSVGGD